MSASAILAIDTSFGPIGLALCTGAGVSLGALEIADALGAQAEKLAPAVQDLLRTAQLQPNQISRIAVTIGPGAFTGVRVGLAFAKGLGLALKCPVLGFSTLQCLAEQSALANPGASYAVAIDARKEETYLAVYDSNLSPLIAPALVPMAEAVDRIAQLRKPHLTLAGSAAHLIAPRLRQRSIAATELPIVAVDALLLARLAAIADPAQFPPRPEYLRAPDAKLPS